MMSVSKEIHSFDSPIGDIFWALWCVLKWAILLLLFSVFFSKVYLRNAMMLGAAPHNMDSFLLRTTEKTGPWWMA
jgi:hypothetical protein